MDSNETVISSPELTKFLEFFVEAPEKVYPYLERLMVKSLLLIKGDISPYPPETEANRPGRTKIIERATVHGLESREVPLGYYERGKGSWRPVKRISTLQKHGQVKGIGQSLGRGVLPTKQSGVAGYVLNPTSEQMGKNWTTEAVAIVDGVEGIIGNATSYVDYVQGFRQTKLNQQRLWKNLNQSIEDKTPEILQLADQELTAFLQTAPGNNT